MANGFTHASEDELELYSLGRTTPANLRRMEEHLLLCETCRFRLEQADTYLTILCAALREKRPATLLERILPKIDFLQGLPAMRLSYAAGLAVLVAGLALNLQQTTFTPASQIDVLQLESLRGAEPPARTGSYDQELLLKLDKPGLADGAAATVQVVDAFGAVLASADTIVAGERANVTLPRLGDSARYVRVLDAHGHLKREYSLPHLTR